MIPILVFPTQVIFQNNLKKFTGMSPSQYQKMVRSSKKDPIYEQIDLENPLSPSDIKY